MNLWTQDREMSQPWSMHDFQDHINNETSSAATFDAMWAQMQKIIGTQPRLVCCPLLSLCNRSSKSGTLRKESLLMLQQMLVQKLRKPQMLPCNADSWCYVMPDSPLLCCSPFRSFQCRHLLLDSLMVQKT